MSEKQTITEDMKVHEEWYVAAKAMKVADLPEFIRHLTEDYGHDYGTICHAVAAAAVAAASAVNHAPCGGIAGFQAGCMMWEFLDKFHGVKYPARLLDFKDLLYPQYADKFRSIPADVWAWAKKEAEKNLVERRAHAHPAVIAHWESVAMGKVPFGLTVARGR